MLSSDCASNMPFKLIGGDEEDMDKKERRASSVYSQYTDPDVPEEPVVLNEASSLSCYANLTNTIIGSGVLGLPYAIANSGLILGLILVVISSGLSIFSLHILSISASKVPSPCFFLLSHRSFCSTIDFLD